MICTSINPMPSRQRHESRAPVLFYIYICKEFRLRRDWWPGVRCRILNKGASESKKGARKKKRNMNSYYTARTTYIKYKIRAQLRKKREISKIRFISSNPCCFFFFFLRVFPFSRCIFVFSFLTPGLGGLFRLLLLDQDKTYCCTWYLYVSGDGSQGL